MKQDWLFCVSWQRVATDGVEPKRRGDRVMARMPWHLRNIRKLIYLALIVVIIGIAISSALDSAGPTHAWIAARELYGLWALSLLLASMLPGPLIFVLPWFPFKGHLLLGRRALGVSAFILAVAHVASYLGPALVRNWHDVYTPGSLWLAGLLIGLAAFADLAVLAVTSRRKAIRSRGPDDGKDGTSRSTCCCRPRCSMPLSSAQISA